ncbi:hypothetical protein [Flagellimonas lutaonensis]|uniref:Secreted protein n=1 Tax=Flagellimonas lutaonensis TaxID=516051 RepID=A0A0D5YT73_9FLAO|nr:hypothetical protein [Allomuricauda lutaonensis]AKA35480.1 hypothetical protein VC82_1875 [Allomuricauda lutaonensis]
MKKSFFLAVFFCLSGILTTNAKPDSMEDGRLCHEIAWQFALYMQQEFGLYGHEMELIYEETYDECETQWQ